MTAPPMPDILPYLSSGNTLGRDDDMPELPRLRPGAWMLDYSLASFSNRVYSGTLRVEAIRGGHRASGDLYQRSVLVSANLSPLGNIGRSLLVRRPNPADGIPIIDIPSYSFYLRVTKILENRTRDDTLELGLQMFLYTPTPTGAGIWSPSATNAVNCTAMMTWMPASDGYPSTADYLEGDLSQDDTGVILGRLTMGWLSNYLRKATIEIDTVPGSEQPLESGSGHNWQTIGDSMNFDLKIDLSERDLTGSSESWSDSDMADAMLSHRQPTTLNEEWRYHILAVHRIKSTPRGIMYDSGATDSNHIPREGLGISTHWFFPEEEGWGTVRGQRFGLAKAPHFRTAVHELGHALGLLHNTIDMGFMNTSDVIARHGTAENPFPSNIKWAFADNDLKRLRHWPDIFIRPGGVPFGDVNDFIPSIPLGDRALEFEIPDLKFEVTPLLAQVPLGAPVRVELKLSNTNEADHVTIPARIDLKSPALHGMVVDASGTAHSFRSILGCVDEVPMTALEPKASVVKSLTLLRGGEGALFPISGVSKISLMLRWALPLDEMSPPPEVVVRASTTVFVTGAYTAAHAKAAHRLLTTPDAHLVLALGAAHLTNGIEAVEAAVENKDLAPHWDMIKAKALANSGICDYGTQLLKISGNCVASHDEKLKLGRLLGQKGGKNAHVEYLNT